MKEHPILFSGPMVRALLAGMKTQTRRLRAPRWVAGDRLWVREAWALHRQYDEFVGDDIKGLPEMGSLSYKADGPYRDHIGWGPDRNTSGTRNRDGLPDPDRLPLGQD